MVGLCQFIDQPVTVTRKELIALDFYKYNLVPLTNAQCNGGFGYTTQAWTEVAIGAPYNVALGSLSYTDANGCVLLTGGYQVTNAVITNFPLENRILINEKLGVSNTTVYISCMFESSFIYRGYNYVGVALGGLNSVGLNQYFFGTDFNGSLPTLTNIWSVYDNNRHASANIQVSSNVTHFLVGRVDFQKAGGKDVIRLYGDPKLIAEDQNVAVVTYTNTTDSFYGLFSNVNIQAGCPNQIGNIRTGYSWESVTTHLNPP